MLSWLHCMSLSRHTLRMTRWPKLGWFTEGCETVDSHQLRGQSHKLVLQTAISDDFLSAVISTRYILGFRKDNPNVFNMLVQNLSHC
jgi:hypothetical protein